MERPPSTASSIRPKTVGRAWVIASLGLGLLALPQLALQRLNADADSQMAGLSAPPTLSGGWQLADNAVVEWKPAFQNPSAELNRIYVRDGVRVGLYIAYFREQNAQRKLVSSENALVRSNDAEWLQGSVGSARVDMGERPLVMRTAELRHTRPGPALATDDKLLVWQTYWVNGRLTASDHWAKAYGSFDRLRGRGDDSAVLVFYASDRSSAGSSEAALRSFVHANLGSLEAYLSTVRSQERQRAGNPS